MSEDWSGHEMGFGVIRKADLIEYLEQSRAMLRDYASACGPPNGLNSALDALKAKGLAADATTFLRALTAAESE